MIKKLMCMIMSLLLIIATGAPAFADSEQLLDSANGEEIVDEVVEDILEEGDFTEEQEEEIAAEVEELYAVGVPVENIIDVDSNYDNELSYEVEYSDGITNEVAIDIDADDRIEIIFTENDIRDNLVYTDDGKIILNGEVVEPEECVDDELKEKVELSTGGVKWTTTKHTKKQATSYSSEALRGYSKNVKFSRKLSAFTVGAITSIMMSYLNLGGAIANAVCSYVAGDITVLRKTYPESHSMSYRKYVSSATKPKRQQDI